MPTRVLAVFVVVTVATTACGGGTANLTPSAAPSPTAVPTGQLPLGFADFPRLLDSGLAGGGMDLTKFTLFGDWSCPNNYFPAAGPNCVQAAEGQGVKAIGIGAYASEGDIYDAPSYGRFLSNWIYDALRDASDTYGSGNPRVYATADMPESIEGYQGPLGTYEVITTRIAKSPADGSPRREVLVIYVAGTLRGWLITRLMMAPAQLLDPTSAEATSSFTAWQRWTGHAPASVQLGSRWSDSRGGRQVAYLDAAGTLFVATADGAQPRVIAQPVCGGTGPTKAPPTWSRDAERIAVTCASGGPPGIGRFNLEIHRSDGPGEPAVIDNVFDYAWPATGHRIAYQTLDKPGGVLVGAVRMRDPDSGEDTLVHDDAVLLDWPSELLLGLNPMSQSGAYFETYEANWYNLATGATERIQRFDNQQQFWVAPSVNKAVVLGGHASRKEDGLELAVYDIASHQETALPGLAIAYGSSSIPPGNLVVSPIGDQFVWADFGAGSITISQAALDGSHATLLDHVPALAGISSDGLVLYYSPGQPAGLTLRDTLTGAETTWSDARTGAIAPVAIPRS